MHCRSKKLVVAAKAPENNANEWFIKQVLWQIYLPAPKHIPRPKFDVSTPNAVHQANLLFLPHDTVGCGRGQKTYKYALTVVDVASHFKQDEPLSLKDSAKVVSTFQKITNAGLWNGHSFCKWIRHTWSWAQSLTRWKNTKQTFAVDTWIFTERPGDCEKIQRTLPSACSDASLLSKCGCPRAKDLPNGSFDFPLWSLTCSEKWSYSVNWQEACWSHQRKGHLFLTCDSIPQFCWTVQKMAPLGSGCTLSLPT